LIFGEQQFVELIEVLSMMWWTIGAFHKSSFVQLN